MKTGRMGKITFGISCDYLGFVFWVRTPNKGAAIKTTPPLFSERHGYQRVIVKLGKLRVVLLPPAGG